MFEDFDAEYIPKQVYVETASHPANFHQPSAHLHDYFEIYYLVEGKTNYIVSDRLYSVSAGDVVLIPPGIPHRTNAEFPLKRVLIYFSTSFIDANYFSALTACFHEYYIRPPVKLSGYISETVRNISNEYRKNDDFCRLIIKNHLEILLAVLSRISHSNASDNRITADLTIQNALDYITVNIDEKLRLADIAKNAGLNASYFSRKFKAVTGIGFNQYVLLLKISHACKLLTDTELSVTEISNQCGFNDSNYFTTVFKKTMNVAPCKYSKQNKRLKL